MTRPTSHLLSNSLDLPARLARKAKLHRLAKHFAPKTYRRWRDWREYQAFKTKVKEGYCLIDAAELEREQTKAVQWLVNDGGPRSVGDYLEFGVFYGSSLLCMHRVLEKFGLRHVRLFGFDSFEGLPASSHPDDKVWGPGRYKSNYRFTQEYLAENGVDAKRAKLTKGFFSDTLNDDFRQASGLKKASLIMVDCDMYVSAKEALEFCVPYIQDRAVIFFDDWNSGNQLAERGEGERRAFEEVLSKNPQLRAEEFGSYSCKGQQNAKVFKVIVDRLAQIGAGITACFAAFLEAPATVALGMI